MAGGTAAADEAPLPGSSAGQLQGAFNAFPPALNELFKGPGDHPLYEARMDGRLSVDATSGGVDVCYGESYGSWSNGIFQQSEPDDLFRTDIWIDGVQLETKFVGPRRIPGGIFQYQGIDYTHFTAEGVPVLDDWALDYGEHDIRFEVEFQDGRPGATFLGSYTVVDC